MFVRVFQAMATAKTLTTQYMVRFSHLTVELPEKDKEKGYIKHVIWVVVENWEYYQELYFFFFNSWTWACPYDALRLQSSLWS